MEIAIKQVPEQKNASISLIRMVAISLLLSIILFKRMDLNYVGG